MGQGGARTSAIDGDTQVDRRRHPGRSTAAPGSIDGDTRDQRMASWSAFTPEGQRMTKPFRRIVTGHEGRAIIQTSIDREFFEGL
jgi:hypothetical protein